MIVAIPLVCTLAILILVTYQQQTFAETVDWVTHTHEVLLQSKSVLSTAARLESSVRDSQISQDVEFLAHQAQARQTLGSQLQQLVWLVRDNPPQQELARHAMRQIANVGTGFDLFNADIAKFEAEERRLLIRREAQRRGQQTRMRIALWVFSILAAVGGALSSLLFVRSITKRLSHIGGDAELMAAGHPLPEPALNDDAIGRLHSQVNEAARLIADRERRILETSVELEKSRSDAEAAGKAKADFLANMSHEIRTPMNGVIGMTELALQTELTSIQREYLSMVKSSADSLLSLLNDILDFSKIEAGKLEIESIAFSLRDRLESVLKDLSLAAHQKGLELVCDVRPDVPDTLVGDPARLRQIMVNLLGNAIKFTTVGEIVCRAEVQEEAEGASLLHFAVTDSGVGIPSAKLKTIFEEFSQADSSMTRKYGGTGLGLSIAARLASLMHGNVWVESELGRGSTFHFTARFAVQTAVAGAQVSPGAEGMKMLRDVAVLIVDDNATNRRVLKELLIGWRMKPTLAEDGIQALAMFENARAAGNPFALSLIDLQMPEMDGLALAERIIQGVPAVATPVILLTSAGMPFESSRCQELGIRGCLSKPVRRADLLAEIKSALRTQEQIAGRLAPERNDLRGVTSRRLRILLAEDNAVNQKLAVHLLQQRGHIVRVAGTGRMALDALDAESFDLILMDVQMPEMDGLEATAAIRKREQITGQHIPIIAMTAHAMMGDRDLCLTAGMDHYLSKPLQVKEFFAVVESLLPNTAAL